MIATTRDRTEPIQIGYHPKNVKNTVTNRAVSEIVIPGFFPLVAIKTTTINMMVNARENMIPASVTVVSSAEAILVSQSDQMTILTR